MIGQLLKITTTPIKYEINIEPAKLEMRSRQLVPYADVQTTPPELKIDTQNTTVQIDTYKARKSLGYYSAADAASIEAQKGVQQAMQSMAQAASEGWQYSSALKDGITIAQMVQQKMLQQPQMVMRFLPEGGAELAWTPATCDLEYNMGDVQYQWQWPKVNYEYTPASISVNILQRPSVNIEYLGEPFYVPPSASPTYDETA